MSRMTRLLPCRILARNVHDKFVYYLVFLREKSACPGVSQVSFSTKWLEVKNGKLLRFVFLKSLTADFIVTKKRVRRGRVPVHRGDAGWTVQTRPPLQTVGQAQGLSQGPDVVACEAQRLDLGQLGVLRQRRQDVPQGVQSRVQVVHPVALPVVRLPPAPALSALLPASCGAFNRVRLSSKNLLLF